MIPRDDLLYYYLVKTTVMRHSLNDPRMCYLLLFNYQKSLVSVIHVRVIYSVCESLEYQFPLGINFRLLNDHTV